MLVKRKESRKVMEKTFFKLWGNKTQNLRIQYSCLFCFFVLFCFFPSPSWSFRILLRIKEEQMCLGSAFKGFGPIVVGFFFFFPPNEIVNGQIISSEIIEHFLGDFRTFYAFSLI